LYGPFRGISGEMERGAVTLPDMPMPGTEPNNAVHTGVDDNKMDIGKKHLVCNSW
jgi:hypothetical protein